MAGLCRCLGLYHKGVVNPDIPGWSARPLAILGPTASGKSALAMAVAERIGPVELVSVDSMQVYRGMDIGTAKPSVVEQTSVRHHLIDLVDPNEEFTLGEFKKHAIKALADIRARGNVAVLVGGTGLYLRAVIDNLDIPGRFPEVLAEIDAVADTSALYCRLKELDSVAAARINAANRRRILRALEVTIGSGRRFSDYGPGLHVYRPTLFVQIALRWPREELDRRIARRWKQQLEAGFLDEVRALDAVRLSRTAAQALGYREFIEHLRGEISLEDALDTAIRRTYRFARRQQRWLRRDPRVHWIDAPAELSAVLRLWEEGACGGIGERCDV